LLAEAGYPDGFAVTSLGIATTGGAPEIDLLRQDYLAKVGIKLQFEYVETVVNNQRRASETFKLPAGLLPAVNPDTLLFGYLHPSNMAPKGYNGARYTTQPSPASSSRRAPTRT